MDSLTLIRHAETDWAKQGRHTGLTDIPLNEAGIAQAKQLKEILKPNHYDSIFVSPLARATETARLAGILQQATIEPDLVEWNYGKYEGLTSLQIHEENPDWNLFIEGAPQGESVAAVAERAKRVIQKLDSLPGNGLVISSAHFSCMLAASWLKVDPSFCKLLVLYPASISLLGKRDNHFILIHWNQVYYN